GLAPAYISDHLRGCAAFHVAGYDRVVDVHRTIRGVVESAAVTAVCRDGRADNVDGRPTVGVNATAQSCSRVSINRAVYQNGFGIIAVIDSARPPARRA